MLLTRTELRSVLVRRYYIRRSLVGLRPPRLLLFVLPSFATAPTEPSLRSIRPAEHLTIVRAIGQAQLQGINWGEAPISRLFRWPMATKKETAGAISPEGLLEAKEPYGLLRAPKGALGAYSPAEPSAPRG